MPALFPWMKDDFSRFREDVNCNVARISHEERVGSSPVRAPCKMRGLQNHRRSKGIIEAVRDDDLRPSFERLRSCSVLFSSNAHAIILEILLQ